MEGILSTGFESDPEIIASRAVRCADALLKELANPAPTVDPEEAGNEGD